MQRPDRSDEAPPFLPFAERPRVVVARLALSALSILFTLCAALAVFALSLSITRSAPAAELLPVQANLEVAPGPWAQTYLIDLGSLPTRPRLVVEATSVHFSAPYVSVEATAWSLTSHPGPLCPAPSTSFLSEDFGGAAVTVSLVGCNPQPGAFAGQTVEVRVFVYNFSGEAAPLSITIRGETRPPTGTLTQQVDPANVPLQLTIPAAKDTVVYADDGAASNGAGASLWAGDRVIGFFPFSTRYPRRSLVAFELSDRIPPIATILAASLRLTVTSGNNGGEPLQLHRIAPGPSGSWGEGNAVAPGDGFLGVPSGSLFAADWLYRDRPATPWNSPGVDVLGGPLGTFGAFPGPLVLSSPPLTSAVQTMIVDGTDDAGFLLSSPNPSPFPVPIPLASREHPDPAAQPQLIVDYVQSTVYEAGSVSTNVVNFINEGQNFRWVYDVSIRDALPDGRFTTDNGGICQVAAPTDPPRFVPYTYGFQGSPAFTGVDCCTWRVESPQTGTVGTGQALFFHGLDASNPANMPPDSDQDGIRDNCDNCPAKANGPLYGTCLIGLLGAPCHSNGECGPGGKCNLSQEDSNGDFVGNVCAVPEPGIALGLGAGVLALAFSLRARAARAGDRRSSSGS